MPIPFRSAAGVKPYNITRIPDTNDAEINMYGEVVDERPVDWWTGEPIEGDFIAVNEFLNDIAELDTYDNITVHINSVGGSLYGGLAIYNRMKAMKANITTIIDGLAASAGGLIFQAGNIRKVNSASNMMVHGALGFLYGYYNVKDLKDVTKQLDAGTKAAVNALAEASKNSVETVRSWVDKETWYTGQEIVDAGFADELIENSTPVSMSLSADKAFLIANGCALSTRGMKNIPTNIPVMPPVAPAQEANTTTVTTTESTPSNDNILNNSEGGTTTMAEFNTIDELRAAYPQMVQDIETAARAEGVRAERERLQGIDGIANAISDTALLNSARYGDEPLTAEQLAFRAMQAQAALGNQMVANMTADADASGANGVGAAPNSGADPVVDSAEDAKAKTDEIINLYKSTKGNK